MPPFVPSQALSHRRPARTPVECDQAERLVRLRRSRTMEAHNAIARWVNEGGGGGEAES